MTEPAPAPTCHVASDGPKDPLPSLEATWFKTRDGRRYGWEIGVIIVVKLVLLVLLWFLFIKPWPRPATASATTVEQLYSPTAPAFRHD